MSEPFAFPKHVSALKLGDLCRYLTAWYVRLGLTLPEGAPRDTLAMRVGPKNDPMQQPPEYLTGNEVTPTTEDAYRKMLQELSTAERETWQGVMDYALTFVTADLRYR